jgi:hypothetical protein
MNWDSSVTKVADYGCGSIPIMGIKIFLRHNFQNGCGAQTWGYFLWVWAAIA